MICLKISSFFGCRRKWTYNVNVNVNDTSADEVQIVDVGKVGVGVDANLSQPNRKSHVCKLKKQSIRRQRGSNNKEKIERHTLKKYPSLV